MVVLFLAVVVDVRPVSRSSQFNLGTPRVIQFQCRSGLEDIKIEAYQTKDVSLTKNMSFDKLGHSDLKSKSVDVGV